MSDEKELEVNSQPIDPSAIDELTKLMTPITSKEHFQAWCYKFLGFTLPDCKVTRYADSTPLDFAYEVYRAMMDGKALNIIGLSGRDTAKTVSLSVIDLLGLLHDQRDAIHIGMIRAQAQRAREYLEAYILKQPLLKAAVSKQNTKEIRLKIGEEEVGLELISLDPKQVQGAHKALVSFDELASSVDPVKLKAYKDASGIPGSSKKGKPAVIVKITSRQTGSSIPEIELKNAHKSGLQVRKWTTIDCMRKCPEERCGTTSVPVYINLIKGLSYTEDEFSKLSINDREGFDRTDDTKEGCLKCPLLQYCQGRAQYQTSDSVLLRSIDDVIHKVNNSGSHEWVLAQLMSLQPSAEGLVYPEFNPLVHIPTWEELWKKLTGEEANRPVDKISFIKELRRRNATFIAGVDWGYTHPATCVVLAIDDRDQVFIIDAIGMVRKDDPEWVEIIKDQIQSKYNIQMYLPDSENPSGISLLRKADLPVAEIDKGPGSVKAGINIVKGLLKVPGTNNRSRLFVSPDIKSSVSGVPGLIEEFGLYSKEIDAAGTVLDEKIRKGDDHFMDALRYALYWYFGKASLKAAFSENTMTKRAPEKAEPSGLDLAQMAGLHVNDNRSDFPEWNVKDDVDNEGKDDDDDDPDDNGGGSGLMVAWT